jgi:hypothetical protein
VIVRSVRLSVCLQPLDPTNWLGKCRRLDTINWYPIRILLSLSFSFSLSLFRGLSSLASLSGCLTVPLFTPVPYLIFKSVLWLPGWSADRVQEYFVWAAQVVRGLRGTNPALERQLEELFKQRGVELWHLSTSDTGWHNRATLDAHFL